MKLTKGLSGHFLNSRLNPMNRRVNHEAIIGLDLGREKLNMVQISFNSGQPLIHAAASDYHDTDLDKLFEHSDSIKKLVKNILSNNKFKGRKVVSTLPSHFLKIVFLNYQLNKNESNAESLLSALKRRINDDLSDYVIDYLPIKPDAIERNDRMALVAMANRNIVEQYLDLLTECGFEVVALEIGPVAIRRLINAMAAKEQLQKILTINFGNDCSYLTVIWNNDLLFDRKIDFGLETIIAMVARAFDTEDKTALEILHQYGLAETVRQTISFDKNVAELDDDNDDNIKNAIYDILNPSFVKLAAEIRDIMVYIASETRGGAVEQIYLMGSLARLSGIEHVIDKLISVPTKIINPFYGIDSDGVSNTHYDLGPVAGVAVATGLALRGH